MIHAKVHPRRYDAEKGCYVYDIAFKTTVPETPRTLKVAESFGLGVAEEHKQTLYEDYHLKINEGDVIYITGDSGSGKSVLLDAIRQDLGDRVANLNQTPPPEQPIIETVGSSYKEAISLLSRVGLNDAILFLRRYNELSEGQKYRYHLAQLISSGKTFWLCDEFLSTLDRTTAKIVAYNIQKQARANGATLIVATTHTDLEPDLNPDTTITKGWMKEIQTTVHETEPRPCSILQEITLQEGTLQDYHTLSYLHYRGARVTAPQKTYKLTHRDQTIGVIVYTYPALRSSGRVSAVGYHPSVAEINRDWALISRVIIHPKYRGMGLGSHIIRETLPLQGRKHVELIAVMAQYNPFAERAGMRLIHVQEPDPSVVDAVCFLAQKGIKPAYLGSRKHMEEFLRNHRDPGLVREPLFCIKSGPYIRRLTRLKQPYVSKEEFSRWLNKQDAASLAHSLQILSVLNQTKAYLYWRKPT